MFYLKKQFLYGIPEIIWTPFSHTRIQILKPKKNINTLQISNKDEPKRGALQAFQAAGDCRKTGDGEQCAEHKAVEHR